MLRLLAAYLVLLVGVFVVEILLRVGSRWSR